MNKKKVLAILQLILIIVIIISVFKIGSYYYDRYKSQEKFKKTEKIFQEVIKETKSEKKEEKKPSKKNSNKELIRKLQEINSDVVGYIEIKDLDISYPILYRNNNYYLRRDINEEYSIAGSIFLEETNSKDFSDDNTVIYGHNMADRGFGWARMFGRLSEYLSKEDLTDIDNVRIYTKDETLEYRIISIYSANDGGDYRRNPSKEDKIKYLQKLVDRSARDFSFDRPVKENDKMITLSTCDDYNSNGRLVVHGVLVDNSIIDSLQN